MKAVIVGAGEVGAHIAGRLAIENKEVVIIDKDTESINHIMDNIDVQALHGSGASPRILTEAGILEAEILLAVTDSDETNLVACLIADILSPGTMKLARIRGADYDKYHEKFRKFSPHINTVINPETEAVNYILRLMEVPGAVDMGEFAEGRVKLVGIRLHAETEITGIPLSQIPEKSKQRAPLIAAILRNEELIIPDGRETIRRGDTVYFISETGKLRQTLGVFDKDIEPVKRAMIIGGGRMGLRLALALEHKSIQTKIIEKNPDRCKMLADELDKTVVLFGDGSDQELLREENVSQMDVVVTLTRDDETNILISLLAKRLGARKTITKIAKFVYFPLLPAIGLDQIVNPRLSAINSILQHIRKGKILSALSLKDEQAEVLEAEALETSGIVDKPIKDLGLPKGALLTGIIRNEDVIIPTGSSIIHPRDRIILFSRRESIPQLEKILTVKLGLL